MTKHMIGRQTPKSPSVQTQSQSQPQTVHHTVQQPGLLSNIWQGFGLGAGQAIAHNIFRSDPPPVKVVTETEMPTAFVQCMKESKNDVEVCKHLLKKE
jgi:hypothetical protein